MMTSYLRLVDWNHQYDCEFKNRSKRLYAERRYKYDRVVERNDREWQSMEIAPCKDVVPEEIIHICVMDKDGTIYDNCHYAEDLSGEYQPAFSGWFVPAGNSGFKECHPVKWRLREEMVFML